MEGDVYIESQLALCIQEDQDETNVRVQRMSVSLRGAFTYMLTPAYNTTVLAYHLLTLVLAVVSSCMARG